MSADHLTPEQARRALRNAGIGVLAVAAATLVASAFSRASNATRLEETAKAQTLTTVVVVKPIAPGESLSVELPGRLEAFSRASLYARVSGYLKTWTADIGTPVKAGQLLAEIEAPDLEQQLSQAKADLATAQANAALATTTAERWKALLGASAVSRQGAEEKIGDATAKRSMVQAAQANLDRLQATKAFTRIVAPFAGVITARNTDVGALINAGGGAGPELFVISDTHRLRAYVNVPQSYAGGLKVGQKAQLVVPELPGRSFAATVAATAGAIAPESGTMLIQLAVENPDGALLPGGFARVRFQMDGKARGLVIPPSALIFNGKGTSVATVGEGDRIIIKPVTIARDLGKLIELASGLEANDRLVESPPDGIAQGEAVRIFAPPTKEAAPASKAPAGKN